MQSNLKVLILAGGSGTRLWPLSRKHFPKQFIKLKEFNNESFFEQAVERAKKITKPEHIYIITNQDYKYHCMNQSDLSECNIIVEPEAKNTLGAIALGIENANDDDIFLVLSSDHIIKNEDLFVEVINNSALSTRENIVIFGIKPTQPHTGYGYINFDVSGIFPHKVIEFKEKPNYETAQKYINSGYYWNAGIFMFSKKVFLNELRICSPDYFKIIKEGIKSNFSKLPDLSVDYGILEKSKNIKISPLNLYWNDLGSFDSFDQYFKENNITNEIIEIEAENNRVILENSKVVSVIGLSDLVVIDTTDALLISKKGDTQKVKEVIQKLKDKKSHTTFYGNKIYRPWGSYTIVDEGIGFKTKRLSVLPGKKLSSQLHYHRSEHWVVVSGTALVTINNHEMILGKGQSAYIPVGSKHRLENPGKTELHIIESQIGDYLEEDDIMRFDDEYGRK